MSTRKLRILTWHVHGNYLYYLSHVPHTFYVLADAERSPGYAGRAGHFPWGDNVVELPLEQAGDVSFDCLLFQSRQGFEVDQHRYLTAAQRHLPRIYVEHDPPREHPTDTRHPVDDPHTLLVHVTAFNRLMWDNGVTPTRVVEHGVRVPDGVSYQGDLPRGLVVANHLARRGRRLGADIFEAARQQVALDLVGMDSEASGGLGEIDNPALPAFMARYRFYFHPVRWTSLGLAAIEAMMVGLPLIGLACTELVTVIENGRSGYVDTDPKRLVAHMQRLLDDPDEARSLGAEARRTALERFSIERFAQDWDAILREVTA